MSLNEETIVASYKIMNHITKGYQWYTDTPEQPFRYDKGSIWLINPETNKWMIQLQELGTLWYFHEVSHTFSRYLNMDEFDFESFIEIWVEDALERGVVSTLWADTTWHWSVEDALERGVVSTHVLSSGAFRRVEDALERGVVLRVRDGRGGFLQMEDALERGVTFTNNGLEYHKKNKFVELCLSFLRKIKR